MATVLDVLRNELEDAIGLHKDALASGRIGDYADYREQVGVITGLTSALERTKDLLKYVAEN